MLINGHTVKYWSSTQTTVALSSAEAELIGIVKGATQGIGLIAFARDLCLEYELVIHTDSAVAKGIASRTGVGRVRHLDVSLLWIQDHVRSKKLRMVKIAGADNQADILAKHVEGYLIDTHTKCQTSVRERKGQERAQIGERC